MRRGATATAPSPRLLSYATTEAVAGWAAPDPQEVERRWPSLRHTVDDARAARAASVPFFGVVPEESPTREALERAMRGEGAVEVVQDINLLPDVLDRNAT